MKPLDLTPFVQEFFARHLPTVRNASPHTFLAYRDMFRLFLRFLQAQKGTLVQGLTLEDLSVKTVLGFLDWLESQRKNSVKTRNTRLTAFRSFLRYLSVQEPMAASTCRQLLAVPLKQGPTRMMGFLDQGEMDHLRLSMDRSTVLGRRDHALILFLYNTGARAQETIDLTVSKIHLDKPAQVKLLGKGRRERMCLLWPETAQAIREHGGDRGKPLGAEDPVFVNARKTRLTRYGLRHIIRTRIERAAQTFPSLKQKRVSPHTLRHTTAMHLLQSGVDLNVIRNWLGHVSLNTTHAYLELDMEMKRKVLKFCRPAKWATPRRPWKTNPGLAQWLASLG